MRRLLLLIALFLTGTMVGYSQVYLNENFDAGLGAWTVNDGGTTADTWFGTTGGLNGQDLDGTEFALVDSDAAGNTGTVVLEEELVSPLVNTAGAALLLLEFDHFFNSITGDSGFVDVFDGTNWIGVDTFTTDVGSFATPDQVSYDVTALANADFQVRFTYKDDSLWAWYWAVDNVLLYTPASDDGGVTAVTAPASGGRIGTPSALTATESISIDIFNYGSDTLTGFPVFYSINGAAPIMETYAGIILPNFSGSYTFNTTANLSAIGNYHIVAWTGIATDPVSINDTSDIFVAQAFNPAPVLPWCQDFDSVPDLTIFGSASGLPFVPELDFTSSGATTGRLRTAAGTGYYSSGDRGITLDRDPSGGFDTNFVVLNYDMSAYDAANDQVLFDLTLMEHGDEVQPSDSIWIRGSSTDPWIGIADWNVLSGGTNGQFFFIEDMDLSAILISNGQNFSSSFQIQVGQEDNFPSTSPSVSDGLTIDDLCMSLGLDTNVAMVSIDAPMDNDCGNPAAAVTITIENDGADTLSNIPVFANVSGFVTQMLAGTVPGPVAPGGTATYTFTTTLNTNAGGTLNITASTGLPGDGVPSDDSLSASYVIIAIPAMPMILGDTVGCPGDTAMFMIANPDSMLTYTWYDSMVGGNQLGTGSMISLPLSGAATFYAQGAPEAPYVVGKPDNLDGGGNYTAFQDGLVFDALTSFVIDSMNIYPNGPGDVVINLLDANGQILDSVRVAVNPATANELVTIPVGISVPVGNGHQLNAIGTTTGGLFRTSGAAVYPYAIPGVVSINNAINNLAGYYYFFYRWQIRATGCPSARGSISVAVANSTVASFTSVATATTVDFTDASTDAISYAWDFGDGNSSTSASPSHTYATDGSYYACLTTFDLCGDSSTFCDSVTVCAPMAAALGFAQNGGAGLTFDFTDNTTGNPVAWAWSFGDGNVSSNQNPTHTYQGAGTTVVTLIVTNACGEVDTATSTIMVVGIDNALNSEVSVFPNPSNGTFMVSLGDYVATDLNVKVVNLVGQTVFNKRYEQNGTFQEEIDLGDKAQGTYFLEIEADGLRSTQRIVVE